MFRISNSWIRLLGLFESSLLEKRIPLLALIFIWLLALSLALFDLDNLPLRDFDEGTVARVAYELSHSNWLDRLLPTLWGEPYLNKPPGLHWLIALVIDLSGSKHLSANELPSEFYIRLAPAFLSSLVVPLGGLIQWQLRPGDRSSCLATSAILLTLLPVARHGRLAMLDGAQLSAMAFLWLMLLLVISSTAMLRMKALGVGFACSSMLLMKAPLLVPGLLAAFFPIAWSGELKLFIRSKILIWIIIGSLPGIFWHLFNFLNRGVGALWLWWGDGAGRVLFYPGSGSDLGWKVPFIEILEGGWPWLVLWPLGILWAWKDRSERWNKWVLGTQLILLLAILPLQTQLPWYNHPLWLPISLLCGPLFAWLIRRESPKRPPGAKILKAVPFFWLAQGIILSGFALFGLVGIPLSLRQYSFIAITLGIGWGLGGFLLLSKLPQKRLLGSISLIVGSVLALFLLMGSPFWLWELNEHWDVQPIGNLLASSKLNSEVALDSDFERPSLNWYSRMRIRTLKVVPSAQWILTKRSIRDSSIINKKECIAFDKANDWNLMFCPDNPL